MKYMWLMSILISLSACESMNKWHQYSEQKQQNVITKYSEAGHVKVMTQAKTDGDFDHNGRYKNTFSSTMKSKYPSIAKKYSMAHHRNINHYIRGISHELFENLKYVNTDTPIAVASFVLLDSSFDNSDLVGQQISESFIHEIYKFGIPVVDFKVTDFIRVTPDGDFILSRDYLELKPNLPIQYVLMGTLVKHESGHLVNARIVGLESKAVVASAQGFLPENITAALRSGQTKDGIRLE